MNIQENYDIEEYFLRNFDIDKLYDSIEKTDFLFLHHIYACEKRSESEKGVYLSELAEKMKLSIADVSKAIKRLQEKGYIDWNMTPDRERTYVNLTSNAIELMHDEREKMKEIYKMIHTEISKSDMEITIATLKKMNEIVIGARKF